MDFGHFVLKVLENANFKKCQEENLLTYLFLISGVPR